MTDHDRQQSYAHRDEMRVENHDAIKTMLALVLENTRAFNSANEAAARHREWERTKFDRIEADIAALRSHNVRQDRVQQHDGKIAEKALSLAEMRQVGRRAATVGTGAALVAIAALEFLVSPLLNRAWPIIERAFTGG